MGVYEAKHAQQKSTSDSDQDATRKPGGSAFRLADNRNQSIAQHATGASPASPPQLKADAAGNASDQPVQRRIKQSSVEYSFLEAYDMEGNPYLASRSRGTNRTWAMNKSQPNIRLQKVDDLHEDLPSNKHDDLYHNLSMGREQRVSIDGQKSIFAPFKTYTFGAEKLPDVGVFNVGATGAEKGALYPDYEKQLTGILTTAMQTEDEDTTIEELESCKRAMMPLILAEDYRTDGPEELFTTRWETLEQEFTKLHEEQEKAAEESSNESPPTARRSKRHKANPVEDQQQAVVAAIKQVTTKLPWAGKKGKDKYRRIAREEKRKTWSESKRPIDRAAMSPQRSDTGGQWEDEPSQLKKKVSGGPEATAQLRFKKGSTQYSFLSAHDLNGNPMLASGTGTNRRTWKFDPAQTDLKLTAQDDLHTNITDDNRDDMYHNLSMGRQQRVSIGGQKAILHPFKSYQFGADTVPEVAVYNVGAFGAEAAKLYTDYFVEVSEIVDTYLQGGAYNTAKSALDKKKVEMMPLITGEDYRTRGALAYFEARWKNLLDALAAVQRSDTASKRRTLEDAVEKATSALPWAGDGGKQNFRDELSKSNGKKWSESSRPIDRDDMSPKRTDTGGKWE